MRRFVPFLLVAFAIVGGAATFAHAMSMPDMYGMQPNPFAMGCDYNCMAMGGPAFNSFANPQMMGQMPQAFGNDPRYAMAEYLRNYGSQQIGPSTNPAYIPAIGLDAVNANMAAYQMGLQ